MPKETDVVDKMVKDAKKMTDKIFASCNDMMSKLPAMVEVKRKSVTIGKKKAIAILMQDGSVKIEFENKETGNKYFESLK